MQKLLRFAAFIAACAGLLGTQSAFAQVITTSALTGSVLSENGEAISGATVSIVHVPTNTSYSTTSRGDGSFVVRGLRPGGPYTVSASAGSYAASETNDVYLDIDRGANVDLRMRAEETVRLEKYTVEASAMDQLFDPNQTGSGSYATAEDIRNLPSGDRSINSLARLDPRVTFNRDPFDRAISVSGVSNRYNSIQVDGVSASDPFGLNANNTAAERNVIPLDSLEALSINTAPYNARSGGFVGAQINAITKSGSNEVHGSAYYTFRGDSLPVFDSDVTLIGEELDGRTFAVSSIEEQTFGATLGGPILKDRLFFYLSYEKVEEQRVAPTPIARVEQATIDQITAAAQKLGFDPGSPNPPASNDLTDENVLAKIDWQINSDHRATFRYNDVQSSRPTFPGFGSGVSENNFSYSSAWYQQEVQNTAYFGQLVSRWSDRLNTELSVSHSEYHSEPKNSTRQPYVQVRDVPAIGSSNTSFVSFGTELSRHANILDVETDTAELFASYELGDDHTVQAGVQFETADIYNLFVQNAYGSYDFANLAQFLAVANNNNGTTNYRTYTYNQILADVEPAALFSEQNVGLFVNDTWRVKPNLKFEFGVRMDMALLPDEVPYNATFFSTFGVRNDHTYDGKKVAQPRFGFNWQPDLGDKRTTVRGGVGLFYGKAPRVWISNSYSNTGMNYRTWTAGTNPASGVQRSQAPIVSADPDTQPTAGGTPAMAVNFMDPDFELPSKWKANLAVERELGFWDLKATAEIEQLWTENDVFYENINIRPTRTTADGRELYFATYAAAAQNASTGAWSGSTGTQGVSNAFTNRILKLRNTDQGESRTMLVSLERPRTKNGWYWRTSYVNMKAEEVLFGTSSVASSNWQNRSIFNPNTEELSRASLEIRDRIQAVVQKDFELVKGFRTTASLFYEGRSGYPFSFVYSNDANGDSQTQNDLVYIPKRGGDPMVRFGQTSNNRGVVTQSAADAEALFFQIVDRFGLEEGKAVSANGNRYPWVNQFDLSLKQEVKLPYWRHRLVLGVDVLNIGNLLNDKWGIIRGSNQFFVKREQIAAATYDGVANQWVYNNVSSQLARNDFNPALGRGEPAASRWTVLLTARYEF